MDKRKAIRKIKCARDAVKRAIKVNTNPDSMFSRGLAYEGYQGGYLNALDDVLLILQSDAIPDRRSYWDDPPEHGET